jgi:hypothetical protein
MIDNMIINGKQPLRHSFVIFDIRCMKFEAKLEFHYIFEGALTILSSTTYLSELGLDYDIIIIIFSNSFEEFAKSSTIKNWKRKKEL